MDPLGLAEEEKNFKKSIEEKKGRKGKREKEKEKKRRKERLEQKQIQVKHELNYHCCTSIRCCNTLDWKSTESRLGRPLWVNPVILIYWRISSLTYFCSNLHDICHI